jgi:hypothetical protein
VRPRALLDRVRDRRRRTRRWNQREDAPRHEASETEHRGRDGIQAVEIVDEPAVEASVGKGALNARQHAVVEHASLAFV